VTNFVELFVLLLSKNPLSFAFSILLFLGSSDEVGCLATVFLFKWELYFLFFLFSSVIVEKFFCF
jgi:hypothetical protein